MQKTLIATIVLGLIFLTGCIQIPGRSGGSNTNVPSANFNFRTGSEGMVMLINPNTPPARIYDNQELNMIIELQNRGAYTLPGDGFDRVYLSGFDASLFPNIPYDGVPIPPLEGKTAYSQGTSNVISFQSPVSMGRLVNPLPVNLMATACYRYRTIAEATVCIDPDPFSTSTAPKACRATAIGLGTQGAPVAVQNIGVEPSRDRQRFVISISNARGGVVFKPGPSQMQACNPYVKEGLRFNERDYVKIVDVSISGASILGTCRPPPEDGQYLRLTSGQGKLFCDFENLQGTAPYTTNMRIELEYGYQENIMRSVTVVPQI